MNQNDANLIAKALVREIQNPGVGMAEKLEAAMALQALRGSTAKAPEDMEQRMRARLAERVLREDAPPSPHAILPFEIEAMEDVARARSKMDPGIHAGVKLPAHDKRRPDLVHDGIMKHELEALASVARACVSHVRNAPADNVVVNQLASVVVFFLATNTVKLPEDGKEFDRVLLAVGGCGTEYSDWLSFLQSRVMACGGWKVDSAPNLRPALGHLITKMAEMEGVTPRSLEARMLAYESRTEDMIHDFILTVTRLTEANKLAKLSSLSRGDAESLVNELIDKGLLNEGYREEKVQSYMRDQSKIVGDLRYLIQRSEVVPRGSFWPESCTPAVRQAEMNDLAVLLTCAVRYVRSTPTSLDGVAMAATSEVTRFVFWNTEKPVDADKIGKAVAHALQDGAVLWKDTLVELVNESGGWKAVKA